MHSHAMRPHTLNGSTILLTAACAAALAGCTTVSAPEELPHIAQGSFARVDGMPVGTVAITAAGDLMHVAIAVSGFTPGIYGTHLHAVGRCEAPAFASAGGHLNPGGHQHGRLNPMGSHMGDLPNLTVVADGTGTIAFDVSASAETLLDADGTAVVIHAGPDDERTDPSGNSGARVACAVLNAAN